MAWRQGYTQRVKEIVAQENHSYPGRKFYLVKSKTDDYYDTLVNYAKVDPNTVFDDIVDAEDAMKTKRGDTLLIAPGEHLVTESLTWDKHDTIIKSLINNPNNRWASTTAPSGGMTRLRCNTQAVNEILNITGQYVQMYGIETINNYDAITNVADITVSGRNFYAEGCSFRGGNGGSTQLGANSGIPIWIDAGTGLNANMLKLVNCYIGSPGNGVRTDGPGAIYINGGARTTFGMEVIGCTLAMRCETSGSAAVSLVELEQSSQDRYLLFKDCHFYNFWENLGGKLDYAVVDAETATHQILFWDCMFTGIDWLCNTATYGFSNNQATGNDGSGKATAVDVS